MKKLYLLVISLCFFFYSEAQFDCSTAIKVDHTSWFLPLAPVGTVAGAGPDYGCLTMLERPTWFYFAICNQSLTSDPWLNTVTFAHGGQNNYSQGFIVWGPFDSLSNACSQLTSNKIIYCIPTLSIFPSSITFSQSGIYIGLFVNDSTINVLATSVGGNATPPLIWYTCNVCSDTATSIYQPLCLVTHDSLTNKNKIIWDKGWTPGASEYVILREGIIANQFDSIGVVSGSLPGEFVDMTSNPQIKSYTYKLKTRDMCNNTDESTYAHKSIHLSASLGVNNDVNLSWTQYNPAISLYGAYYIYRSTPSTPSVLLDSLSLSNNTYTDLNPPAGQVNYQIEYRPLSPMWYCSPTSAFSNNKMMNITGISEINEDLINVFPNPAKDKILVKFPQHSTEIKQFYLKTVDGHIVQSGNLSLKEVEIDVSDIAEGVYFLEFQHRKSVFRKKIVIQ